MLTELGIIGKNKAGIFIINTMIVDLRNCKIKTEDNRTMIESKENKLISNDYENA